MLLRANMLDSMFKDMGIRKSGLVIGDVRDELFRDLMKVVEKVVNEKVHLDSYYLLIVAKNYGRDIKTTVMPMSVMPPKMFGSICYLVDNRRGKVTKLWTLPLDLAMPEGLIESGKPIEEIVKSGKDMPIG